MKRILAILFVMIMTLMLMTPMLALAEATAVATDTGPQVDWGTLITQVVVWILGALAAVAGWALKRYVYPWFLKAVIPWLKTHNLISVADMAVKYAEAELGRHLGAEKWKLAIELMQAKGFDIYSDEVIAALKAAWETLDLQQISAGVKDAGSEKQIST